MITFTKIAKYILLVNSFLALNNEISFGQTVSKSDLKRYRCAYNYIKKGIEVNKPLLSKHKVLVGDFIVDITIPKNSGLQNAPSKEQCAIGLISPIYSYELHKKFNRNNKNGKCIIFFSPCYLNSFFAEVYIMDAYFDSKTSYEEIKAKGHLHKQYIFWFNEKDNLHSVHHVAY